MLTLRCFGLRLSFVFSRSINANNGGNATAPGPAMIVLRLFSCSRISDQRFFIIWREPVGGESEIDLVTITTLIWRFKIAHGFKRNLINHISAVASWEK